MGKTSSLVKTFRSVVGLTASAVVVYTVFIRPWHIRWGAADDEVTCDMPGDELMRQPVFTSTRAVTIQAPPECVWKWLVQIGYGRAGWYSYDTLETAAGVGEFLEVGSAARIIPALQNLKPGDQIKTDPDGGFTVLRAEPPSLLLLRARISTTGQHSTDYDAPLPAGMFDCTWAFNLRPLAGDATRLVSRTRFAYLHDTGTNLFGRVLLEPAVFIMERKMLQGIQARSEERYKTTGCEDA